VEELASEFIGVWLSNGRRSGLIGSRAVSAVDVKKLGPQGLADPLKLPADL
jgi:hypothetical protein